MDPKALPPLGRLNFTPHAHQCINPRCRFVWAHDPDETPDEETFDRAHDCPHCGTHATRVYAGARPPVVIHDGAHRPTPVQSPVQYVEERNETRRPHNDPVEMRLRRRVEMMLRRRLGY